MNITQNEYIMRNPCTFVKYSISPEYDKMCRDYLLVDKMTIMMDEGKAGLFNKDYSYGILTNIYDTNVFILDIDNIKHQVYYAYDSEDKVLGNFAKEYNNLIGDRKTQRRLNMILDMYYRIFGSKLLHIDIYKTNDENGIHIYFELDANYDLSGVYKYELSKLVACNGYLKFVINSGYSNIRITNKILETKPKHLSRITKLDNRRVFG